MAKWLRNIFILVLLVPFFAMATARRSPFKIVPAAIATLQPTKAATQLQQDTIINKQSKKQADDEEKIKIKEIAKAKKHNKPEKVDEDDDDSKKRKQRRPEGVERPPEIIRRNGG